MFWEMHALAVQRMMKRRLTQSEKHERENVPKQQQRTARLLAAIPKLFELLSTYWPFQLVQVGENIKLPFYSHLNPSSSLSFPRRLQANNDRSGCCSPINFSYKNIQLRCDYALVIKLEKAEVDE